MIQTNICKLNPFIQVLFRLVQDIFRKIHARGFTSTAPLEQLHCAKCDKFLADRFVHGTCPHCEFDDARGDQCDGCGKLLDATDLLQPFCFVCKSRPQLRTSTHIFVDLDRLADDVTAHFESVSGREDSRWSANANSIVRGWLKQGLERRCITRDLKWGVHVPLEGFESKVFLNSYLKEPITLEKFQVFYVWFDAPIGYLSITKAHAGGNVGDAWKRWWKAPESVELFHFLGKDNVAFHGIIFPACLLATGEPYTMVRHICATEHLTYGGDKFSKSRGKIGLNI